MQPPDDEPPLPQYPAGVELRMVQLTFRHGARSPEGTWAPPGYEQQRWPRPAPWGERSAGPAEETSCGLDHVRRVGAELRTLYVDRQRLLSGEYSPRDLLLRSTNVNRTLESAYHLMCGMFPHQRLGLTPRLRGKLPKAMLLHVPYLRETGDPEAVPVEATLVFPGDMYGDAKHALCQETRYEEVLQHFKESPECREFDAAHVTPTERKLQRLLVPSPDGHKPKVDDLFHYCECLVDSSQALPAEVTPEVFRELEKIAVYHWFGPFMAIPDLLKLAIGRLLREIIERFEWHMAGLKNEDDGPDAGTDEKEARLVLYSAHDSTVAELLIAFGVFDMRWPEPASHLHLELFQDPKDAKYSVRLVYNNKVLTMPGQLDLCPWPVFRQAASQFFEDDSNKSP